MVHEHDLIDVTVYRWVQRFTPLLIDAARPCRHCPGDRWFADETYVKVAGRWVYLYRAIDQFGQVIDGWYPRNGIWQPPLGSSPAPLSTACARTRLPPIEQRPTHECSKSCCRRRVMSWSNTQTIPSNPIMDGSRPE